MKPQTTTSSDGRRDRHLECHYLGHLIETIHARETVRVMNETRRIKRKWEEFFDPHAATELGELLYNRLVRSQ